MQVRVQTRSAREGVDGRVAGRVRVRVGAAPVDDAANRRVVELVAKAFGVAPSRVEVVSGATRRDKCLRVREPRTLPDWLTG